MDAWNSDYDRRRADAETNEEILHQRQSTLEIAADVQLTNSQETQAPAEAQAITWLSLVSGVLRIAHGVR